MSEGQMLPNGQTVVVVHGMTFRGPTATGNVAGLRYAALRRMFREAQEQARFRERPSVDPASPEGVEALKRWQVDATAELLDVLSTKPETWDVVAETLAGWSVDGPMGEVALDRSTVFRGWPSGPLEVAVRCWSVEGFLLPPGMHRPPAAVVGSSPSVTPSPSTPPGGTAV